MDNQKDSKIRENRNEDRKALKKYWIIMIFSCFCGMLFGIFSVFLSDSHLGLDSEEAKWVLRQIGVFGSFAVTTVLLLIIIVIYRQTRAMYRAWDGENEETYNRIEERLSYALTLSSIGIIFGYFFFSFGIYVTELWKLSKESFKFGVWEFWIVLSGMIYSVAGMSIAQQRIVNFDKELNPEKKGSVFDVNFSDKWMESSDEAERFITYKAAYQAFRMMRNAFPVAWIISLLGMIAFETGLFPSIVVLVLWTLMVCSYSIHSIYYIKHPPK